MPQISSMSRGPAPLPVHADAATGFDEVTKGYVPWSMSRSRALRALEDDRVVAVQGVPHELGGVRDVLLDAVP
jgi:hypothetical protein